MKVAVLSMEVEDWYHLDYLNGLNGKRGERRDSMLDGLEQFRELLREYGIPATFFVLGELASSLRASLRQLADEGHEIASHGWDHRRPTTIEAFSRDVVRSRVTLEDIAGVRVLGYRAPCFRLDRARLDRLPELGYSYDSSRIDLGTRTPGGILDIQGFDGVAPSIFRRGSFFEFEVPTLPVHGRRLPISSGGYLRMLPWWMMRGWLSRYLALGELYVLYLHPFELSRRAQPRFPAGTRWRDRVRFSWGRGHVRRKLESLIGLLRNNGYQWTTLAALRERWMASRAPFGCDLETTRKIA